MAIDFGSTFATYNYYQKNSAMALKTKAAEPIVKNDIAYSGRTSPRSKPSTSSSATTAFSISP